MEPAESGRPAAPAPEPRRAQRLHAAGRLSFRRRVPEVRAQDLPCVVGGEDPPALSDLVPEGYRRVEIEVGPGKGIFLLAAAQAQPETFFLGIEAAVAYGRHAAERLVHAGVRNALLLVDNANLYVGDRIEPGTVDRIHVYYPDPWPKRRHRKRRFFHEGMPEVLARALRPGGHLLVATDNACYAGQIALVLGSSTFLRRDPEEERRLLGGPPGFGFTPTAFERKYLAEGRVLRRYAYRKPEAAA